MPGPHAPLAVRIDDGQTDRHVTKHVRGLKWTKTAPGGHQNLQFQMVLPHGTFNDLGPQDRAYVYDARTARPLFDAYLDNPTPTDGPDGQQFDVLGYGGMARANDESRGLIYIDRTLNAWEKATDSAPATNVETGNQVGTTPGARVQFTPGQPLATGSIASIGNYEAERAGITIGGLYCDLVSGKTDAAYATEFAWTSGSLAIAFGTMSTTPTPVELYVGDDFTDTNRIALRLRRTGAATNIADDTTWMTATDLSIIGRRMDRHGNLLTGAADHLSAQHVLAHQVVEDLLGRLLTFCDPGTAVIDETTWPIDQLTFFDGVRAAEVLTALSVWEPDMLWEIGETLSNGLHRFAYRAWPTEPRYEVSVKDGWRQAGGDVDLCNRVLVSWTDADGKHHTTPVTAADLGLVGIGLPVDELEEQGRTKDAEPVRLPDGFGSEANAVQIGAAILRDKLNPPRSGTVTVARPVRDLLTGSMVMPWELEPGYVCRVREPGYDLRLTQVDYDDDAVAATLTLGTPAPTLEQRTARLSAA